jgi:hypothetical protein
VTCIGNIDSGDTIVIQGSLETDVMGILLILPLVVAGDQKWDTE